MLSSSSNFRDLINLLIQILDRFMMVIVAVIVLVFFWRILTAWFMGGADPKEIERGKQSAVIGLVVLVFILGLWSIVGLIRFTFFGG